MDGDDDDQGHSINDDYRMAGLPGDDESDLEADREELFSAFPSIPVDVDAEDVDAGPGAGAGDNPVADVVDDGTVITGVAAKKQKATSEAWNDFEKIFETINGK
jgi:hypothetical protein